MRHRVMELLRQGLPDDAAALAAGRRGGTRFLAARLWDHDELVRNAAAEAVGRLAIHAPDRLVELLRRFMWSLNDESGASGAATLPALVAVARWRPAAVAPHLGALVALLEDDGLRQAVVDVLETLADTAPDLLATALEDIGTWAATTREPRLAALAGRLEGGKP